MDRTWTLATPCFRYQVVPHLKGAFTSSGSLLLLSAWLFGQTLASPSKGGLPQADPLQPHGDGREGPAGQGASRAARTSTRALGLCNRRVWEQILQESHITCVSCTHARVTEATFRALQAPDQSSSPVSACCPFLPSLLQPLSLAPLSASIRGPAAQQTFPQSPNC